MVLLPEGLANYTPSFQREQSPATHLAQEQSVVDMFHALRSNGEHMIQDLVKIVLGAVAGFIVGVLTEPVKLYWQRRSELAQMKFSIYRELAGNFQNLVGFVHTIRLNNNPAVHFYLHDARISSDRYGEAKKDLIFDRLSEATTIVTAYAAFGKLRGLGSGPTDMEVADSIIVGIEQAVATQRLNRRLFFRFLDERLVRRMKKAVTCANPFPR